MPEAILRLRQDNIVYVTFKEGVTLDVPMQYRMLEKYNEICDGKKLPFIFDAMDHVTITKEARDNATKIEHLSPVFATAVIANTLAYKLIASFYIKFNKPKGPFKIFRNEDEAVEWLKQFL